MLLILFYALNLASAPLNHMEWNYRTLTAQNYNEIQNILRSKINQAEGASVDPSEPSAETLDLLTQACQILFMRPDPNQLTSSLALIVKTGSEPYIPFFNLIRLAAQDSILEFKKADLPIIDKVSHLIVIENILEYLTNKRDPSILPVLKTIANGKLKITKQIKSYRYMETIEPRFYSPSQRAAKLYKEKTKEILQKKSWWQKLLDFF